MFYDTVVVVGRRILHKAGSDEEQTRVMRLVSGRASHVLSAVCLINKNGREALRFSDSRVLTKRLSEEDIRNYVATGEWKGCSGYKIEGRFAGLSANRRFLFRHCRTAAARLKRRIY